MDADLVRLRVIASAIQERSKTFGKAFACRSKDMAPSAGQTAGLSSADATRSAVASWETWITTLAGAITGCGAGLASTVEAYALADKTSSIHLGAAGS